MGLTMKAKILLILLFVNFVKTDVDNCNVSGQCINAQISHLVTVSSQSKCLERCLSFDDCKWYTFHIYDDEINCELYRTCESVVNTGCDYCVTGQNTCPTDNCAIEGFCLGTMITSHDTGSRSNCDSYCRNDPGCQYYSITDKNYGYCYLFKDCPSIDETLVEFESSQVGCPVYG